MYSPPTCLPIYIYIYIFMDRMYIYIYTISSSVSSFFCHSTISEYETRRLSWQRFIITVRFLFWKRALFLKGSFATEI